LIDEKFIGDIPTPVGFDHLKCVEKLAAAIKPNPPLPFFMQPLRCFYLDETGSMDWLARVCIIAMKAISR
jgi:hypothetical protein